MNEETKLATARNLMTYSCDKIKMYADLDQSKAYSEFRPRYSKELYKTIADYCRETMPDLGLAVDVGCGPGMSTLGFCKYFEKVIGIDVSETQIACAPTDVPNCEFKVGYSHQLPFIESGTADLFCSGQSFYFMPQKETLAEADRVLRPGGTVALFGYGLINARRQQINEILQKIFVRLMPYMPKETTQAVSKLRETTLPYSDFIRREDFKAAHQMTLEEFIGFIKSTWPYVAYSKDYPNVDTAADMKKE
ncbi:trans-aconitate 2-methyltransferase [Elysia marginata]|uniref:Trans-aconitate 2-methyltransferase n=1 Tax=Elysia marginata TaxID=1093978 RepID=A0AAV4J796_9GAST|nr:trans-aconitate 2-methyltransferase [Elysia marginata]